MNKLLYFEAIIDLNTKIDIEVTKEENKGIQKFIKALDKANCSYIHIYKNKLEDIKEESVEDPIEKSRNQMKILMRKFTEMSSELNIVNQQIWSESLVVPNIKLDIYQKEYPSCSYEIREGEIHVSGKINSNNGDILAFEIRRFPQGIIKVDNLILNHDRYETPLYLDNIEANPGHRPTDSLFFLNFLRDSDNKIEPIDKPEIPNTFKRF